MNNCPKCKSSNIAEIVYGYPTDEYVDKVKNNPQIRLGGCSISPDNNEYHCNNCDYEWIRNVNQIKALIDRAIKEIWIEEISYDVENSYVLYEDTLKNAYYFHLRKKIDKLINDNNIRIYTEFHDGKLAGKGYKADIAIVKINNNEGGHLKHKIENIFAIIELKFKSAGTSIDYFISDVEKAMIYIKDKELSDCQFYLGFIHEEEFTNESISWLQNKKHEKLAIGRLTELSACYYTDEEEMKYTVLSYNGYNTEFNSTILK